MKIKTQIENLSFYYQYLKVLKFVREFFEEKGYLEIDLPLLSPALIPEAYLEVFQTQYFDQTKKENLYLIPSPELFLKRLLVWGVGDCYFLGKAFRNSDPPTTRHNFEFTILEFYKKGVNYLELADEVLNLLQTITYKLNGTLEIVYQGKKYSFSRWEKLTVEEAFARYANINKEEFFSQTLFLKKAQRKGYSTANFSYAEIFSQIYVQEVEPHLGTNYYPTLIYDYPPEFAALAKLNSDGKTAQRFEFYLAGVELGDCYTELTDPQEQRKRFTVESTKRKKDGKIKHPVDLDYLKALQTGLSHCSGIAIGFDRLGMIFADVRSIQDLKLIVIDF
jgi:EF-P lysine aminoacylase GenX